MRPITPGGGISITRGPGRRVRAQGAGGTRRASSSSGARTSGS